jgi:aminoglycoside 6-adenylyltransferase
MRSKITDWLGRQNDIRLALMVGSRAGGGRTDPLSDFDISLFGETGQAPADDQWLDGLAPYWICIHDHFIWEGAGERPEISTRLVIFDPGIKVDFAFHPVRLADEMMAIGQLTKTYDAGFEIIVDKDGRGGKLPRPSGKSYWVGAPSAKEFHLACDEFWFESYHVAKYLYRRELWVARIREAAMKKWLLKMMEWNAAAKSGFSLATKNDGKNWSTWANPSWLSRFPGCFGGGDPDSAERSLYATMDWFRELGEETATALHIPWSDQPGSKIRNFIQNLIPSKNDSRQER